MLWFSRPKCCIQSWKYTDKRHKWKGKVQKNARLIFCRQTKGFASLTAKRLACFETTKAAKFLKKFQVILYSMVKESTFLNEKLCIIGVWQTFCTFWHRREKKKYKMCQLRSENYFMLNFAADFPFVNVSVTRIAFKD